jgi:hypothetical protein
LYELRQIQNAGDVINDRVASLAGVLARSEFGRPLLFKALEDVGALLNQSGVSERTIEAVREKRIVPQMWNFLRDESPFFKILQYRAVMLS